MIKEKIVAIISIALICSIPAFCNTVHGPDLTISAIQVYPQNPIKPKAGKYFTVQVEVANIGNTISGQYDIELFIKDVVRGSTYPIGIFRQGPMNPNDNYQVYSSNKRMVNEPGFYRIHAEIKPFLFEDANPENNTLVYGFIVE